MTQVLVVEDNLAVLHIYRALLESRGVRVTTVSTGEDGLESVQANMPSAVLMDLKLPKMSGIELLRGIRLESGGGTLPIIVSTSSLSRNVIQEASSAGATQVLEKAYNPPKKIIEVVLDALQIAPLCNSSAPLLTKNETASIQPAGGPTTARRRSVDVISALIDILSGFPFEDEKVESAAFNDELVRYKALLATADESGSIDGTLSALAGTCETYFHRARFFLQEKDKQFNEVVQLLKDAARELSNAAGALDEELDGSSKRFGNLAEINDLEELKRRVSAEVGVLKTLLARKRDREQQTLSKFARQIEGLQSKLQQAEQELETDPLTKLANRGSFDRTVKEWIERHSTGNGFVLAMIDLDDFKKINDSFGHQVGDRVLKTVADWLLHGIRKEDFVGRYGGEEFVVLMDSPEATRSGQRLTLLLKQLALSKYNFEIAGKQCAMRLTASCGVAAYRQGESLSSLISRADSSMYEAKRQGKNRVVVAE